MPDRVQSLKMPLHKYTSSTKATSIAAAILIAGLLFSLLIATFSYLASRQALLQQKKYSLISLAGRTADNVGRRIHQKILLVDQAIRTIESLAGPEPGAAAATEEILTDLVANGHFGFAALADSQGLVFATSQSPRDDLGVSASSWPVSDVSQSRWFGLLRENPEWNHVVTVERPISDTSSVAFPAVCLGYRLSGNRALTARIPTTDLRDMLRGILQSPSTTSDIHAAMFATDGSVLALAVQEPSIADRPSPAQLLSTIRRTSSPSVIHIAQEPYFVVHKRLDTEARIPGAEWRLLLWHEWKGFVGQSAEKAYALVLVLTVMVFGACFFAFWITIRKKSRALSNLALASSTTCVSYRQSNADTVGHQHLADLKDSAVRLRDYPVEEPQRTALDRIRFRLIEGISRLHAVPVEELKLTIHDRIRLTLMDYGVDLHQARVHANGVEIDQVKLDAMLTALEGMLRAVCVNDGRSLFVYGESFRNKAGVQLDFAEEQHNTVITCDLRELFFSGESFAGATGRPFDADEDLVEVFGSGTYPDDESVCGHLSRGSGALRSIHGRAKLQPFMGGLRFVILFPALFTHLLWVRIRRRTAFTEIACGGQWTTRLDTEYFDDRIRAASVPLTNLLIDLDGLTDLSEGAARRLLELHDMVRAQKGTLAVFRSFENAESDKCYRLLGSSGTLNLYGEHRMAEDSFLQNEGGLDIDDLSAEDIAIIRLRGNLSSTEEAQMIERQVNEAMQSERHLVMDLTDLSFMGSSVIGLLMKTHRRLSQKGARLVLVNPRTYVLGLLRTTHLDKVLTITDTLEQGIAATRK